MLPKDYTTHYIFEEFGTLAYHVKGPAITSEVIIFFHGHFDSALENGSYHLFDYFKDIPHILLDFRWHGCSTRLKYYPTFEERAEDIEILIRDLLHIYPSLRKIYLSGYSQGATILYYYLLTRRSIPEEIRHSFLIAPRISLGKYKKWFKKEIDQMKKDQTQEFQKKYSSKGMINYEEEYTNQLSEIRFFNLAKNLSSEATLIRGELDSVIPQEEADRLILKSHSLLSYHQVEGCRHNPKLFEWHKIGRYIRKEICKQPIPIK